MQILQFTIKGVSTGTSLGTSSSCTRISLNSESCDRLEEESGTDLKWNLQWFVEKWIGSEKSTENERRHKKSDTCEKNEIFPKCVHFKKKCLCKHTYSTCWNFQRKANHKDHAFDENKPIEVYKCAVYDSYAMLHFPKGIGIYFASYLSLIHSKNSNKFVWLQKFKSGVFKKSLGDLTQQKITDRKLRKTSFIYKICRNILEAANMAVSWDISDNIPCAHERDREREVTNKIEFWFRQILQNSIVRYSFMEGRPKTRMFRLPQTISKSIWWVDERKQSNRKIRSHKRKLAQECERKFCAVM